MLTVDSCTDRAAQNVIIRGLIKPSRACVGFFSFMRYFFLLLTFLFVSCQAPKPESESFTAPTYTYSPPRQQHVFWKTSYAYREEPAEALVQQLLADSLASGISVNLFNAKEWVLEFSEEDSSQAFIDARDMLIRYMLWQLAPDVACNFPDQHSALTAYQAATEEPYRLRAERELFEPLGIDKYRWQEANLSLAAADFAYFLHNSFAKVPKANQQRLAECLGFSKRTVRASGRIYPVYFKQDASQLLAYCPELKGIILLQCSRLQDFQEDQLLRLALEAIGTL